ncbi:hypothetical protein ACH5RR_000387 [Cinchona calisaya]|uniref:Uncharacterized protein n=1 Tax=Cinchona calisaya TaxID=153742 RepID=A0ABD3B115_9GENT
MENLQNQKLTSRYHLTRDEKSVVRLQDPLERLKHGQKPDGYASNLARYVDRDGGKLLGMKSHDCHMFMEQLLPSAFSGLPASIWKSIIELSLFLGLVLH